MQLAALSPILHASLPRRFGRAGWLAGTLDVQQGLMQGLQVHYRERFRLGGQQQEATIIALSITFPSTCRSSLRF
jgi:hypothetical protein